MSDPIRDNPAHSKIVVRELKPELLNDYLQLFDRDAFSDNPWWSGCYCGFYDDPCTDKDWDPTGKAGAAHRAARIKRIKAGVAQGLLAYINDKPVGWCNAAPRSSYVNLRYYAVAVDNPNEPVVSIMCFVVSPHHRERGVATALLSAACMKFRRDGLTVAEGYPRTKPLRFGESEAPWQASNYHGPLDMYLKAGFTLHRQLERFAIVRKGLDVP